MLILPAVLQMLCSNDIILRYAFFFVHIICYKDASTWLDGTTATTINDIDLSLTNVGSAEGGYYTEVVQSSSSVHASNSWTIISASKGIMVSSGVCCNSSLRP